MPEIDPTSVAGVALTVLSYGAGISLLLWLSQIVFTPYLWSIICKEYGFRLTLWPREAYALRQKYAAFRYLWNANIVVASVFFLSLFGMMLILVRYRV
jgi:hypothetical protein